MMRERRHVLSSDNRNKNKNATSKSDRRMKKFARTRADINSFPSYDSVLADIKTTGK